MKCLITGFTGQVGSTLADYLLKETSMDVIGMMRWQETLDNVYHLTERINNSDRTFVEYGDLNDLASIVKILSKTRPEFISHLGAQSYPKTSFDAPLETLQTNIIGTANLLEAVKFLKDDTGYNPVVHVCSSSEVYGRATSGIPLSEQSRFHGASPYSISKIGTDYLGQFYGEAYGIKTFVTRMGTHSGPRRSDVFFESTVAKQIALIEHGFQKPIIHVGNLNSVRTYQDARDAVEAYYLLMKKMKDGSIKYGEAFNISGTEVFNLSQIIDILLNLSKCTDIKIVTDPNRLRPIDADYQMFDNSKLLSVIDWEPKIPVSKMLEDLLNHWRSQVQNGKIPLAR